MQGCQFAVALDYWAISEILVLLCGFPNYLCEVSLIVGDPLLEQWECYGGHSGLYILLSNLPEHVDDCHCLSKPLLSVLVLFYLFCRVWVPLLYAC